MPFDFSDDAARHYVAHVERSGRSAGNNVAAFFRATFDAWKDHRRGGEAGVYVGYSPIIVVDADADPRDLPGAHVLHVVRNPVVGLRRHEEAGRAAGAGQLHARLALNQYYALLSRDQYPTAVHVVRAEDVMADPYTTLSGLCRQIDVTPAAVAADDELEWRSVAGSVSLGHDPARDTGGEPSRPRASCRRRARRGCAARVALPRRVRLPVPSSSTRMKRVVLTGGTGFVGANLAHRLVADGHEVTHLLVRPGFARWRIEPILDRVSLHEADLPDADRVSSDRNDRAGVALPPRRARSLLVANRRRRDHAHEHRRHEESAGRRARRRRRDVREHRIVVGVRSKDHAPSETEEAQPDTPYGIAKAAATAMGVYAATVHGARVCTLRLYSVYGP